MSFRKQNSTILVCLAGLFIASMGFSLSVLAVIAALLTSAIVALFSSGQPIIETRDAAVKASTHSPPGSLRRKVTSRSTPRKSPGKLRIDVTREVKAHPRSETDLTSRDPLTAATPDVTGEVKVHLQSEADMTSRVSTAATPNQPAVHLQTSPVASPHQPSVRFLSSPVGSPNHHAGSFHSPTQETTHFLSPTQEIPSIAISPPPTRLSHHSESSRASTEINTLSSVDSSHSSPPAAEPRGRRRLRFSKIVHLFGDKQTKIDRRLSLSSLPSDAAPPAPPASLASPPSSPPASSATCRRQTKLMTRVASCPIILHHHHHHSSVDAPHESSAEDGLASPTRSCPLKKGEKKEKEKEAAPRPRTQPYAAPYFIPPPDSVDVEDPIPRRRPSRRRTMPPPERRTSGL
ncbi:hypothetical protein B0H11DRAFT_2214712 [Mycena galericulata]|nr:hypothetical protein B0H11DRAFT_2214712 [Mycena galericulata]